MSAHADAARRESPIKGRDYKTEAEEHRAKATEHKNRRAGSPPRDRPATQERDSLYTTRRHKSTFGSLSPSDRMDSREQIYSVLGAWDGQTHE